MFLRVSYISGENDHYFVWIYIHKCMFVFATGNNCILGVFVCLFGCCCFTLFLLLFLSVLLLLFYFVFVVVFVCFGLAFLKIS